MEGSSVLRKCKHEAFVDLPKFLVLTCSCLACPLVGVGPYGLCFIVFYLTVKAYCLISASHDLCTCRSNGMWHEFHMSVS